MNSGADAVISGTAAHVATRGEIDIAVGGLLNFTEKCGSRHDLTGLAVPALRNLKRIPCRLNGFRCFARKPFDGHNLPSTEEMGVTQDLRGLPST